MRAFVAINPSGEERRRLHEASSELRRKEFPVRWVPRENVHLTLKFLGEVQEGRIDELKAALRMALDGVPGFEMRVNGFGAFPSARRPRVLWAGVEAEPSLERVQERVETALAELGFEREGRPFHPHLTLGRARRGARPKEFRGMEELLERLPCDEAIAVRSVDVMRSRLKPSGAEYEVLEQVALGGGS